MRITDFNLPKLCHKMSNTFEIRIGKMRNSTERCRKCERYFPRETRATSAAFPIFALAQKYDIWRKLAKVQGITTLFRVLCKSRCKALSLRTKVVRDSNTGVNQNLKENRNTPWIVERGKKGEMKKKKKIMALEQMAPQNVAQLVETREPIVPLNRRFASLRVESEGGWKSPRFFHEATLLQGYDDQAIPILGKTKL